MPTIRPITLACEFTLPTVEVRQQPYPLAADEPEFWITTVSFGDYPDKVNLEFQSYTPGDGVAAVNELVGVLAQKAGVVDVENRMNATAATSEAVA